MARNLIKTKFAGIYYEIDEKTKVKTYIARIKVAGIIDTEQVVGYSNDSIRTNPTIAFEKRQELINTLKSGASIKIKEDPTFDKSFSDYIERRKSGQTLSEAKIESYELFYKKHIPDTLKRKKLKQITKDELQKVVDNMVNKIKVKIIDGVEVSTPEYKPSYVVTVRSCLSPFFKEMVERDLIIKNLIPELKFPKYDKNKYFNLEEEKAKLLYKVILNMPHNQYRAMFMLLLRGRRSKEIRTLAWENIDFEKKIYIIEAKNSKIKKTLVFPMDDELLEALRILTPKKNGFVFISRKTGTCYQSLPKRLYARIKKELDIKKMTFHDFRHLLGMTLVNNGVPLEYISKALGHSRIATTQMYSNQKESMAKVAIDSYLDLMR